MGLKFYSLKEAPDHKSALLDLIDGTWSQMILSSKVLQTYWNKLYEYFPEYQLMLNDGTGIIAYASTIPFYWETDLEELPEQGWDWLLEQGIKNYEASGKVNYLGGLLIGVHPEHRGRSLSRLMIDQAKKTVIEAGLNNLVIPIRPTLKDAYPEIPMEEYIHWEKDGKIFDPWIRRHVHSGAQIIKVCKESMTIEAPIQQWEDWSGKRIHSSGEYPIEGALSLVKFSTQENKGLYAEPNVWIYYEDKLN